jgi:hypothetical protein
MKISKVYLLFLEYYEYTCNSRKQWNIMWHANTQTIHETTVSSVAVLAYQFRKLIQCGAEATDTYHINVWPKMLDVSATPIISPDILLLTYSYA